MNTKSLKSWGRILLLVCLAARSSTAQTELGPSSVADRVLIFSFGFRQTNRCQSYRLNEDGSAVRLFSAIAQLGHPTRYDPPASGTYTYQQGADGAWALLRLELREGPEGALRKESFELLYQSKDSGILAPIVSVGFNRFVLLPQNDVTPLQNSSLRSSVAPGEHVTAGGVAGAQGGWKLLRAAGPTLADFGVQQPLAKPTFRVMRKDVELLPVGDWRTDPREAQSLQQIASLLGAFPLSETGADAACFTWVPPGPFLVHCVNSSAEAGDVLLEVYPLPSGL